MAEDATEQQPVAAEQPAELAAEPAAEAPKPRRGRPRKADAAPTDANEGLDVSILPPSIARADNDSDTDVTEEAPRKRTRRARPATEAAE